MYKKIFGDSWNNFKPVLLVPDLIKVIFAILFGILFVILSGFYSFLKGVNWTDVPKEEVLELFKNYFSSNLVSFIVYGALFFILSFVVGAGLTAFKYNLVTNIINKKRIKLFRSWKKSMDFIWRIILLRVLLFLVGVSVVLVLSLFLGIFFAFNLKVLGIILTLLLFFLVAFLLQIAFYFIYPVMFLKNKKAVDSLRSSVCFARDNFHYTFVIWFFTLLIIFVTSLVFSIPERFLIGAFSGVYVFVRMIINIFAGVYVDVVRFYAYKFKH